MFVWTKLYFFISHLLKTGDSLTKILDFEILACEDDFNLIRMHKLKKILIFNNNIKVR